MNNSYQADNIGLNQYQVNRDTAYNRYADYENNKESDSLHAQLFIALVWFSTLLLVCCSIQ